MKAHVRVHRLDLLPGRRAQHLDDFDQLVNTRFTREEWLAEHEFGHNTTGRPDICKVSFVATFT